jgi:hypothetical protein
MKKIGIFLTIAVLVSGCASGPPPGHPSNMTWYQPGVSAEQTERDLAACQYNAIVNAGGYSVQGSTLGQTMLLGMVAQSAQQNKESLMVQSQMAALGYSLVKTNSPLLSQRAMMQDASVSPETAAKLLGHWLFVAPPESAIRGQVELYYLPQNRYKIISNLINTNGQPGSKTSEKTGRYYFVGNELVQWADTKDQPNNPIRFAVSDEQLTLYINDGVSAIFQRQMQ